MTDRPWYNIWSTLSTVYENMETEAVKHFGTYVICHLQGPCAPTPQLKPNIYHPLVKILFLKEVFKLFLSLSLTHSVCRHCVLCIFISNPGCGNWFAGVGERQIATLFNQKPKLALFICSVCHFTQFKRLPVKALFLSLFFSIAQQNIDSIEKTLWWDSKEGLSKCKSKQNKKAKGAKTHFILQEDWSNFIVSCEWLYYIHFVSWHMCLEMPLLSSPHTSKHFPMRESFWDLDYGYKQ